MIKMTALTGPCAGQTCEAVRGIGPVVILDFLEKEWDWEIDYSHATVEEERHWRLTDLLARAFRALGRGLCVEFGGEHFRAMSVASPDVDQAAYEFEVALRGISRPLAIEHDDHRGMKILVGYLM